LITPVPYLLHAEQHFHIAFQGGGAKGVAYLGAFKALKDLFPETRIRSFIGASAGGLLAMAVSAGAAF
jgi:predicted acylesterase/phospholipase RssA